MINGMYNASNEAYIIAILQRIEVILSSVGGGGGGTASSVTVLNPSTNYSLETTQQDNLDKLTDILTQLESNSNITNTVWVDDNDVTWVRRESLLQETGVITVSWVNPQTNVVGVPTFPVNLGTPTGLDTVYVKLIDDVAGDQTGALVNYYQMYSVDPIDGTRLPITTLDEFFGDYTVLGTPRLASEIGTNATTANNFELVPPLGTWTPTALTRSFALTVNTVGNPATPPTYTGSNGITTNLFSGANISSGNLIDNTEQFDLSNIAVTSTDASDVIYITYNNII